MQIVNPQLANEVTIIKFKRGRASRTIFRKNLP